MIKNVTALEMLVLGLCLTAGCERLSTATAQPSGPEPYQGIVEFEERLLGFELGGRVTQLAVDTSDEVKARVELARLDDGLERANRAGRVAEIHLAEAQLKLLRNGARPGEKRRAQAETAAASANEALLRQNLERARKLAANGALPSATVDDLQGQLDAAVAKRNALEEQTRLVLTGTRVEEIEAAQARLEAAQAGLAVIDERLTRYALSSDVDGYVLDVLVDTNEVVGPGAPVVSLADIGHPYVDVFVPQGQIGRVTVGAGARVRVDTSDRSLPAKVEHIGRRTEFTPRFLFSERERPNLVIRVRVRVDDPDHVLRGGVPAFVTLDGNG